MYDTIQRRANIFLPPRSTPSPSPLVSSQRHPTCTPEQTRQSLGVSGSPPSECVDLDAVRRIRAELLRLQRDLAQLLGNLPPTTAEATGLPVRRNLNPGTSGRLLDSFELSPLHMATSYGISTPLSLGTRLESALSVTSNSHHPTRQLPALSIQCPPQVTVTSWQDSPTDM